MYELRNISKTNPEHPWLVELHNDPEVLKNVTDPKQITLETHLNWWNSRGSNQQHKLFCVDGYKVGFTKFTQIDFANKNLVLGADIHQKFRNKGYAKYMWLLMLKESFETLGMHRVSLITAEYNTKAIHIYEKIGFKHEGKSKESLYRDGKYHDAINMYMINES